MQHDRHRTAQMKENEFYDQNCLEFLFGRHLRYPGRTDNLNHIFLDYTTSTYKQVSDLFWLQPHYISFSFIQDSHQTTTNAYLIPDCPTQCLTA